MEMDAENPPIGAGADWTIMQGWDAYSEDDHAMWDRLFERQAAMLEGRVVPEFLQGLGSNVDLDTDLDLDLDFDDDPDDE